MRASLAVGRLLIPQRDRWVDLNSSTCGIGGCEQCRGDQDGAGAAERYQVDRADAEEQRREPARNHLRH
jgi:hypothetical protein